MAYKESGSISEALKLFEKTHKCLAIKLGDKHPATLTTLDNLAMVYLKQGDILKAIKLHEQVRESRIKILGPDHPDTLRTVHNLAVAYRAGGRIVEAMKLFEGVRESRIKIMRADDPELLLTLNNLAATYQSAGKHSEAIVLLEEVRTQQLKQLGADHPKTMTTLNNLAMSYHATGKLALAIDLHKQILKSKTQKLEADNPSLLTTQNNLAGALATAGEFSEAIKMYEEVRIARTKKLGANHPDTIITLNNLARAYQDMGRPSDALPLFEQILKALEVGQFQHVYATPILSKAILAFDQAGQLSKSEVWIKKWAKFVKQRTGEGSSAYANQLVTLGFNQLQQKKWSEAEITIRDCLTLRQKIEPDAWTTFNTQSLLGAALLGQKKYADAEPLLLKGYEGMVARLPQDPPGADAARLAQNKTLRAAMQTRVSEALDRLIQLYTETNKPDEVKKWQAEKAKYNDGNTLSKEKK